MKMKSILGIITILACSMAFANSSMQTFEAMANEMTRYGMSKSDTINFINISKLRSEPAKYIAALNEEIAKHPNNYRAYDSLGTIYQEQKNMALAEKNYKLSLAANRRGYYALDRLGSMAYNKKDYKGAIEYFEDLINYAADYPLGHYGRGISYLADNQFMRAFNDIYEARKRLTVVNKSKYPEVYEKSKDYIAQCDKLLAVLESKATSEYNTLQQNRAQAEAENK